MTYDFVFFGTGLLEDAFPRLAGRASIAGDSLLLLEFTGISGDGPGAFPVPSRFHVVGDSVWFIDHTRERLHAGALSEGGSDLLLFPPWVVPLEFINADPFFDEIFADSLVWLGYDTLSGVECHTLLSVCSPELATLWHISTEDHLPRRIERIFDYSRNSGAWVLIMTDLIPGHPSIASPGVPEGYRSVPWAPLLSPGSRAPDFFLADTEGMVARLSDYTGNPLILAFVSSWSTPSHGALALLSRLGREMPRVPIATVFIWERVDPLFRLRDLEIPGRALVHGDAAAEDYLVRSVPVIYLIDGDGEIVYSMRGSSSEDEARLVEKLKNITLP